MTRPGATRGGVYLAGPSGFTDAGRLWHETVVLPAVVAAGLVPKDPWADQTAITDVMGSMEFGLERRAALQQANLIQGRRDLQLIDESEAILASLDGADVDSGTALEIGYGYAKGLLVIGLRTDIRISSDNEGSVVNLMVETCAVDSGGFVTSSLDEAIAYLAERIGPGEVAR
jgi:nucleoside 2-deoxyribosyltransferase